MVLDVYDSWEKFGTISVTSRTEIISAKYKKGDKRDIENHGSTSFLNLYYKFYSKGHLHFQGIIQEFSLLVGPHASPYDANFSYVYAYFSNANFSYVYAYFSKR